MHYDLPEIRTLELGDLFSIHDRNYPLIPRSTGPILARGAALKVKSALLVDDIYLSEKSVSEQNLQVKTIAKKQIYKME